MNQILDPDSNRKNGSLILILYFDLDPSNDEDLMEIFINLSFLLSFLPSFLSIVPFFLLSFLPSFFLSSLFPSIFLTSPSLFPSFLSSFLLSFSPAFLIKRWGIQIWRKENILSPNNVKLLKKRFTQLLIHVLQIWWDRYKNWISLSQ